MAEKPNQTPKEKEGLEDEVLPPTPETPEEGTEGDLTPKKEPKDDELPSEPVDYKKKFSESSREVQRILEESKLKDKKIAELEANKPPSEEEFAKTYPDWEFLSDEQKGFIKRQEQLEKDIRDMKEEKAWQNDFSTAVKKFPQLAGKEKEFKDYCYQFPKGINAETLAKSFLFEESKPEVPKEPRKGLEKPTGGRAGKVPPQEMTLADIKRLRETNEKLYIKMIREGRIKKIPEE